MPTGTTCERYTYKYNNIGVVVYVQIHVVYYGVILFLILIFFLIYMYCAFTLVFYRKGT